MGTPRGRSSAAYGSIARTRVVTVTTAAAQLYGIGSAVMALQVYNMGTGTLIWGDSNIAVNSGNNLYPAMSYSWEFIEDSFALYLRAESVQTFVAVTEYGVP